MIQLLFDLKVICIAILLYNLVITCVLLHVLMFRVENGSRQLPASIQNGILSSYYLCTFTCTYVCLEWRTEVASYQQVSRMVYYLVITCVLLHVLMFV